MSRKVKVLVIGTALLCLGVGGYAGQVWWAKETASRPGPILPVAQFSWFQALETRQTQGRTVQGYPHRYVSAVAELEHWQDCPWFGEIVRDAFLIDEGPYWRPKRAGYEILKSMTGEALPDDPAIWEAWFKSHPDWGWEKDETPQKVAEYFKP